MAEPEAGVDVAGDPADDGVLRRDAGAQVPGEHDGGGAAVPDGLLKSGTRGQTSARSASKYTLLEAVVGKGHRLVVGDEVEPVTSADGKEGWRLTELGVKDGIARLQWVTATFNDRGLHRVMSEAVYADQESWEFYRTPVYATLGFFVLALFVAVPKDRARRMVWKHGRRLRGPELVRTSEFNEKLGRSTLTEVHLPDGVAFINEEQSWSDRVFRKKLSRWARIPRDREAMHFLIVGDSGTGKSAAIRQMLSQVADLAKRPSCTILRWSTCRSSTTRSAATWC